VLELEFPPDLPGCSAAVPRASALPPASLSSYLQPSARIRAPSGCRALEPSSSFRPRAVDLALPALHPRAPSGLRPSSLRPPPPTSTPRPRALAPVGSSPRSSFYRLIPRSSSCRPRPPRTRPRPSQFLSSFLKTIRYSSVCNFSESSLQLL
jgi:hypothetical protein